MLIRVPKTDNCSRLNKLMTALVRSLDFWTVQQISRVVAQLLDKILRNEGEESNTTILEG